MKNIVGNYVLRSRLSWVGAIIIVIIIIIIFFIIRALEVRRAAQKQMDLEQREAFDCMRSKPPQV